MQIRLSRDLEDRVRVAPGPITVEEFFARFPEVPRDLRDEPVLAEFVRAFGSQLRVAQKPSPCVAQAGPGDAAHHLYTPLVHPLAIYGIGLAELTVGKEPEGRDESSGEGGGDAVVDVYVSRERWIDHVPPRLEVQDRERASTDRAENWAGVLPAREDDEPSRVASEHLSNPAGS